MLAQATSGQAQDEPENLSKLDRLPTWHPARLSIEERGRRRPVSPDEATYATLDDLIERKASGQRVEALTLTGLVLGPNAHKLTGLLSDVRVLTLQYLTTGQADSLFAQVRDWSRLERLTIDIAYPGPDRVNPNGLVTLPVTLRRFRNLHDLRIRENGLNWAASMPVLAGMKALRRLEIDRWHGQPKESQQPVFPVLQQLTALQLSGDWLLSPEIVRGLSRLTELDLHSLQVNTATLQEVLNQLPALETFRMTQCWHVQKLSFSSLDHLKTVELAYNDIFSVDAALLAGMSQVEQLTIKGGLPFDLTGLSSLPRLRYLNVMGNGQSTRLPESIHTLRQLTDLRLYNVLLGSLPRSFGLLPRLQTLHVNQCGIDSLPATFGQLTTLRDLKMYANKLRRLPNLHGLRNLHSLNISGAQITTLPKSIGQLTKLIMLNLSENQLAELPASVTHLGNLKSLIISHNKLEQLPDELGRLRNLEELSIHLNQLTRLPASLSQLRNLRSISADYNQLESLPDDINNLHKLRFLSINNNQLTSLPNSLGQLDSLRYLWIGHNRLHTMPATFSQLRSLTDLLIDDNLITELPADIGNLEKLTNLNLNKLYLTELPPSVGNWSNLQSLIIENTPLRTLPDSIGALVNLQYVRLTNNALTTLPNSISQWRAVETLDLSDNRIDQLPNGIGDMSSLTELIIVGKKRAGALRQLPDSIVHSDRLQILTIENQPQLDADDVCRKAARLKNLSDLSVVNCHMARLPEVDWKKVSWQKLNVAKNKLTELPVGLIDAPKLQYISASENHLPDALNRYLNGKQALLSAFAEAGKLPVTYAKPNRSMAELLRQTAYNDRQYRDDQAAMLRALSKAIDYAPDTVRTSFYATRAHFYFYQQKDYAHALADYDTAILYVPWLQYEKLPYRADTVEMRATLLENKARVFNALKQHETALSVLEQADRIKPMKNEWLTAKIQVERGRNLTAMGQLQRADSSYHRAIQLYEKLGHGAVDPDLWVAELSLMTGEYNRVKQILGGLTAKQINTGYGTWKAYLNECFAILDSNQTGGQAVEALQTYMTAYPERVYSRLPDLFENWFVHSQLPAGKKLALRQLTDALTKQQNKPNGHR